MKFVIDGKILTRVELEDNDTKVIIPEEVGSIGGNSFCYKMFVKEIVLPSEITIINNRAFIGCESLEEIYLPDTLKYLGYESFKNCKKLKKVHFPNSLNEIGVGMFSHCLSLEEFDIPKSIKKIEREAFSYTWIKELILPDEIKDISTKAFSNMYALEKINIPFHLEKIEDETFKNCESLKEVIISPNVKIIKNSAFYGCSSLEKLVIPNSVNDILNCAFEGCKNLREVVLSSSLKEIKPYSFAETNIEKIIIPDSVKIINRNAFRLCEGKEIYLGNNCVEINEDAFEGCNTQKIRIGNFIQLRQPGLRDIIESLDYYYLNNKTGEILGFKENQGEIQGYTKIKYKDWLYSLGAETHKSEAIILSLISEPNKNYLREDNLTPFFLSIIDRVNRENYSQIKSAILNSKTFFNFIRHSLFYKEMQLKICHNPVVYSDLFTLAHTLGAFSDEQVERQKACEFLNNVIYKKKLLFGTFHSSFESLIFNGYNKEWANFFMNKKNFEELLTLENEQDGFMARIYNSFDKIKEFGRSNRGNQRYRKVTIDMCKKYLTHCTFEGVNGKNVDIAKAISLYTRDQKTFDEAIEIREKYLLLQEREQIKNHILDEELFSKIEKLEKETLEEIGEIMSNLNYISNTHFSYEYLNKLDAKNFVLGKYCSCCSHLEGAGFGIMSASILHPDCQNLVIRNETGKIVAKSTLYVNRKQGYGVFNNVEVSNNYNNEESLKLIYLKYKEAVSAFTKRYNEINSSNPLIQINVGMNFNDLSDFIEKDNEKSKEILQSIRFSEYGKSGRMYRGDWYDDQYIVWKNDNKTRVL